MSSIIDPILELPGGRKLTTVAVTIGSGAQYGSANAAGLEYVNQVLGAYLTGNGLTTANGIKATPYINLPNGIGVSLSAANGAASITANVLVQGY